MTPVSVCIELRRWDAQALLLVAHPLASDGTVYTFQNELRLGAGDRLVITTVREEDDAASMVG